MSSKVYVDRTVTLPPDALLLDAPKYVKHAKPINVNREEHAWLLNCDGDILNCYNHVQLFRNVASISSRGLAGVYGKIDMSTLRLKLVSTVAQDFWDSAEWGVLSDANSTACQTMGGWRQWLDWGEEDPCPEGLIVTPVIRAFTLIERRPPDSDVAELECMLLATAMFDMVED